MSQLIEVMAHTCAVCEKGLKSTDRITSLYKCSDISTFAKQAELGIAGGSTRNYWAHLFCDNTNLGGYLLQPDIHSCIECKRALTRQDLVIPVFQVMNPRIVNPADITDVGLELAERIFFIHHNCRNTKINQVFVG